MRLAKLVMIKLKVHNFDLLNQKTKKYKGNKLNLLDSSLHYPEGVFNTLRTALIVNEDVKFLFNYIFPIEKYKTLMSIYSVESASYGYYETGRRTQHHWQ